MKREIRIDIEELTRRRALSVFLGAGTMIAFGCGDIANPSSDEADASTGTDTDAGTDAGAATSTNGGACAVTPEGEIGPYFADDSDARFNRSNIVANIDGTNVQTGIPLKLVVTVVDTEKACVPYANAQVDIWHCNAAGVYSDEAVENTITESWLRGYQMTDSNGQVTFETVIPGWYQGRTTHVHLRVRSTYSAASSTSDGTNTTQLFFDQSFVDTLATTVAPYSSEGKNSTTNASDHVYTGETSGANVLSLTGDDTNGYVATVTIHLPITSSGTSTPGGGGGPEGGPGGGGP